MKALELPVTTADQAKRVVRALGKHRYVAGKAHFVHALAAATLEGCEGELASWARRVLADDSIDKASRDERLLRRATEDEVCEVLSAFWDAETALRARDALLERLERFDVAPSLADGDDDPFPVLIDAGWELLPLAELDPERHRGAIEAFGESIWFETARFEEQEHLPEVVHLQELDAFGVTELVDGAEAGELTLPLALWISGNETYQDYVVRGVLRAAKIT